MLDVQRGRDAEGLFGWRGMCRQVGSWRGADRGWMMVVREDKALSAT